MGGTPRAGSPRFQLRPSRRLRSGRYDYGGFGEGWALPDEAGVDSRARARGRPRTRRNRRERRRRRALVGQHLRRRQTPRSRVSALVNGEPVAARDFSYGDPEWHIELPARATADGELDLAFEIEGPTAPPPARLVQSRRAGEWASSCAPRRYFRPSAKTPRKRGLHANSGSPAGLPGRQVSGGRLHLRLGGTVRARRPERLWRVRRGFGLSIHRNRDSGRRARDPGFLSRSTGVGESRLHPCPVARRTSASPREGSLMVEALRERGSASPARAFSSGDLRVAYRAACTPCQTEMGISRS